jgi:hypothetical protein
MIRQSANTRNWEKAGLTARALEDAANPHKPEVPPASLLQKRSNVFVTMKIRVI